MSKTRPDIIVQPNQQNNIIELLNAQQGHPAVNATQTLRIQNKTDVIVYVHKTDAQVDNIVGGKSLPMHWQAEISLENLNCIVTCSGKQGRINVEVLS